MRARPLLVSLLFCLPALAFEPADAPAVPNDDGAARVYHAHSYNRDRPGEAGLDDQLSLHVQNFQKLLAQTGNTCSGIVLFINGMAIKGLPPVSCDLANGHVRYLLKRTEQSEETWHILLGKPSGYRREVSLSVGATDQFPIPSSVVNFKLGIIPPPLLALFAGVLLTGLLSLVWLSSRGGLLRVGLEEVPAARRPYSLAQFQMAFWFFLVVSAYVFIWLINGELDTITDSVLVLLGVGAGTALGSSLIDRSKQPAVGSSPTATVPASGKPQESRGFLQDLLTDGGSLSLHRFQLFVWTIVLGVIFCGSVYRHLAMPEFSATLLGLMGLSSGTYLGFKLPEGKNAASPPAVEASGTGEKP